MTEELIAFLYRAAAFSNQPRWDHPHAKAFAKSDLW